jgi:uncharacterized coiled-coil protein SlyX
MLYADMDRTDIEQRLAKVEERIASGLRQIAEQRDVVTELERNGSLADHAKYLLAGLQLLQAAHGDARSRLLKELVEKSDLAASEATPPMREAR